MRNLVFGLIVMVGAAGWGCSKAESPSQPEPAPQSSTVSPAQEPPRKPGCRGCHPFFPGKQHDFPCQECHLGDGEAADESAAHSGLVTEPAHPDRMSRFCGKCHEPIVERVRRSIHFTLAAEVNLVRNAFSARKQLDSLTQIPQEASIPTTPLQLVDDLLRRRCLRCHLYSSGDVYPATVHGTGCAACHLSFTDGNLADHGFIARPGDQQCLSCHYGNRVGADYYGRFDHDVNWDFRTPFRVGDERRQPYGLAYHQLTPDIHQQAGMACVDCHTGRELMDGSVRVSCLSCHAEGDTGENLSLGRMRDGRREVVLAGGKTVISPPMKNPAHARYGAKVGCQVCHGQWSYTDRGTHLLRLDDPDFDSWQAVTRQGSAELEARLETALFVDGGESEAVMTDGITGKPSPGLWIEALESRRWEEINTCLDDRGVLQICRPILDLHLSYANQGGEVVFDAIAPVDKESALVPYTPHTTGKAGPFYLHRMTNPLAPNNPTSHDSHTGMKSRKGIGKPPPLFRDDP